MKKLLLIAAVVGLAGMLAVPAMAADLTATGFIGVTGNVFKNLDMAVPAVMPETNRDEMGAFLALRGRLGFNIRASEDLYGVFLFELDSNRFGEQGSTGNRNNAGTYGADRNALEIKNVYIDFRVPPKLPIWLRVGIQPYYIRPLVFSYFDAAGVSARAVIDPIKLNITGYYAKAYDTNNAAFAVFAGGAAADPGNNAFWEAVTGSEFYLLDMNVPLTFGKDVSLKPGAFFGYQTIRLAGDTAGISNGTGFPGNNLYPAGVDDANIWWLGFYMNGKIGPFPMEVDFIYQDGSEHWATPALDAASQRDYGSWLLRGWVSWVWKNLEIGGGGMYVQGDDADTAKRYEGFVLPQPATESPGIMGDTVVFTGGWMGTNLTAHAGCLLGPTGVYPGFWFARGFAYYKFFPWLKVGAQLAYIGDTVKHGDYNYYAFPTSGLGHLGSDADDDSGIGWEVDFGVNVQIYKNLSFNGAFGYLFAQKALSLAGGYDPADPWSFVGQLMYTF